MAKTKFLVIVESPSKCQKIENYLNESFKNYTFKCIASVGHIMNLPRKKLSVDVEDGFKPDFSIIPDENNLKTVNSIKALSRKYKNIILATDQDREGERIAFDLATLLKLDIKDKNRMVFNEITKPAICNAFNNLKTINKRYVDSQTARRVLDRLIGYKISDLTMREVQKRASAGRVLSVTTRIIYDRRNEIDKHIEEFEFITKGNFKTVAKHILSDCDLNKKYKDKKKIVSFLKKIQKSDFYVGSITSKEKQSKPPAPFITSTINQASPYSVRKTTQILQSLYQSGLITYIRTDSTTISKDFQKKILDFVDTKYGKKYVESREYTKKIKGSQDAHECIRPTDIEKKSSEIKISDNRKLYDIIWKRTVASQMSDYIYNSKTIKINIKKYKDFFTKICNETIFDGWKKLYMVADDKKQILICKTIKENEKLKMESITSKQTYSKPIGRFTEGALIKKLENLGIGRPSTYGGSVSNMIYKNYVNKGSVEGKEVDSLSITVTPKTLNEKITKEVIGSENNRLILTPLGNEITVYMLKNFPDIMDYNYTSNIENDLDIIADGNKIWNTDVVEKYYNTFMPTVTKLKTSYYENRKKCKESSGCSDRFLIGEYNGKNLYRFSSKWGPRVRYGEFGEDDTQYLPVTPGTLLSDLTVDDAISFFPKNVGNYLRHPIMLHHSSGKSAFYIKYNGSNYPLHWDYKKKLKDDISKGDCVKSIKSYLEYKEKKEKKEKKEEKKNIDKKEKKVPVKKSNVKKEKVKKEKVKKEKVKKEKVKKSKVKKSKVKKSKVKKSKKDSTLPKNKKK
jgi:DNA topoisomerase-1